MSTNLMSAPSSRLSSSSSSGGGSEGGAVSIVLVLVLAAASLLLIGGSDLNQRILMCLCITMILMTTLTLTSVAGVVLTVSYAAIMGGVKRWLIPMWGYETNDPIMLVLPVTACLLTAQILFKRRIHTDTLLSKLILALAIIFILEIFNPLQGGPLVGLGGALFWIIPLLWYFVGRDIGSAQLLRTLIIMSMVIGVLGGLYGAYQQFFGVLESEKLWMRYTGFVLGLGSTVKVFSTFCSAAEYAQFLEIASVLGFIGAIQRRVIPTIVCIISFVMLIFSGNRGPIFACLAVFALIWAVQGKTIKMWIPRLGVAAVLAVVALIVGVKSVKVDDIQNRAAHDLVQHQVEGLSDPLGKSSTGGLHLVMFGQGIWSGFRHPVGMGTGATNLGSRLSGNGVNSVEDGGDSEIDLANCFVCCGFVGGTIYAIIIYLVLRSLVLKWLQTRSTVALQLFGMLVVSQSLWLMGGHYVSTTILWLSIGCLDKIDSIELLQSKKKPSRRRLTGYARFQRRNLTEAPEPATAA